MTPEAEIEILKLKLRIKELEQLITQQKTETLNRELEAEKSRKINKERDWVKEIGRKLPPPWRALYFTLPYKIIY